jgi:L-aspartate oxidase
MPPSPSHLPIPGGADVVVIGGGVAGLSAALAMPGRRVVVVTKRRLGDGGASPWAQGGVAVALGPGDSPQRHAEDTIAVAAGIADRAAVTLLTGRGPERVEALRALGARFDLDAEGGLAFGREAAHTAPRILHAGGDATGAEMVRALALAVRRAPWIAVVEEHFAEDLLVDAGRVVGVLLRDGAGTPRLLAAGAVVLGTGGIGQVYRYTTNPPEATGDGLAMAARAGALLADLEFVQFHPTALVAPRDPLPLLTEALRGEGAVLVDGAGRRFMTAEHPLAELAPRDVVARAIWRRREAGEQVFLDARDAVGERFPARFPTVYARCREQGFDPRVEPLPVTPAAHYHMGGIAVDLAGRSSLSGLWACGEVASTGAHGANRLASNSLLEALVFGAEVGDDVESQGPQRPDARPLWRHPVWTAGRRPAPALAVGADDRRRRVRELAWRELGVEREAEGLTSALDELEALAATAPPASGETRNVLEVARLVAAAALLREESRGAHWRSDHPAADPAAARRTLATAAQLELAVRDARPRSAAGTRA